jgi:hypothetical protein
MNVNHQSKDFKSNEESSLRIRLSVLREDEDFPVWLIRTKRDSRFGSTDGWIGKVTIGLLELASMLL